MKEYGSSSPKEGSKATAQSGDRDMVIGKWKVGSPPESPSRRKNIFKYFFGKDK